MLIIADGLIHMNTIFSYRGNKLPTSLHRFVLTLSFPVSWVGLFIFSQLSGRMDLDPKNRFDGSCINVVGVGHFMEKV